MTNEVQKLNINSKVLCTQNSIGYKIGKNCKGKIQAFSRFSRYHGQETLIRFDKVQKDEFGINRYEDWFWLRDVQQIKS